LDSSSNILPFLAVRHLDVSVASITDAGEFLQVISSSSYLESLLVTFDRIVPTPEQLRAFFTIMQRSSFCDTLITFALQDRVEINRVSPHSLDAHTLSPLLQCRNLERVSIDISYGHAAIDNSLLKEITLAWPCLRYISLRPYQTLAFQGQSTRSKLPCPALSFITVSQPPIRCFTSGDRDGSGQRNPLRVTDSIIRLSLLCLRSCCRRHFPCRCISQFEIRP